jgi:hypothetical protein
MGKNDGEPLNENKMVRGGPAISFLIFSDWKVFFPASKTRRGSGTGKIHALFLHKAPCGTFNVNPNLGWSTKFLCCEIFISYFAK